MRRFLGAAVALSALLLPALPALAAPDVGPNGIDPRFLTVYRRTDDPQVRSGRTFYWGPEGWWSGTEFLRESPNGLRTVQYYDKARMELNAISGDEVTNGLLVVELASGQLKRGLQPYDNETLSPAQIPVAGNPAADNPNAPTYATFAAVSTINSNGYTNPNRIGQRVDAFFDRAGNISPRQDLATPETQIVQYNTVTGHNIPRVFWDFLNKQGPILTGSAPTNGNIVDWLFAMGVPISDPYWSRAKIGASEQDVLVQLYERRVLTYVPSNPDGFKVEMGNVGQHYFQWRYPDFGQPWAIATTDRPNSSRFLTWAGTDEGNTTQQVFQLRAEASTPFNRTAGDQETLPFSVRRSFDQLKTTVIGDSKRYSGNRRQLVEIVTGPFNPLHSVTQTAVRRLTDNDSNDFNPAIAPDGAKIAFASDRAGGVPQLFLMPYTVVDAKSNSNVQLTNDGCINEYPSWTPDGRDLVWERQCPGKRWELVRGTLKIEDQQTFYNQAQLTNVRAITGQESDNRYPRIAPNGKTVAFTSYRDGNAEIYTQSLVNNSAAERLTVDPAEDEAPAWSGDGFTLTWGNNSGGRWKLNSARLFINSGPQYTLNLVGRDGANYRWPVY